MTDLPLAPLLGLQGLTIEVLDIGPTTQAPDRHTALVAQGLARVVAVEPAAERTAALLARGVERVVPVFLGDGGGARLYTTRDPRFSSLFEPDPAVIDLFTTLSAGAGGNFQTVYTTEVQTARLDDVLPEHRPDFMRLDIQGGELAALEHGTARLASAVVVEVESALVALYKGQPLLADVHGLLRRHGFVLHKLIDVVGRAFLPLSPPNRHEPISQLLWGDAVFVRDFGALANLADDQLLKGALILSDVYHSFDLALLMLTEHDRRRGTAHAAAYHQALQTAPSLHPQFLTMKTLP
ncbi:MAG TPA: FkbM family methyltransferase [Candidatus Sulfotelmatobacter sp.]|nr:FkbM family methyltransferase [Candidatus Sulfotelmatobacter sp.]